MKKFYIIMVLAIALLAIVVNAVPSFFIVEASVNLASQAGKPVSSSFTLNNNGSTNLDINFTGLILTNGSNTLIISALANETELLQGSTLVSNFDVVIPSSQAPGLYTGILIAIPNESNADQITITVDVQSTFSVSPISDLDLGGASLATTKIGNFSITNTGDTDLTNVTFAFSATNFNFKVNKSNFVLSVNQVVPIEFNLTIPEQFSTGKITLGTVNLVSTELNTTLFDVKVDIGGGLEIEDLDILLSTRPERRSDGLIRTGSGSDLDIIDGKSLDFGEEEVGPESELRFNFNIENTFRENENIDINDITIEVIIENMDDGEDVDEETEEFDIDSGKNDDVDVFLNIPLSVDEGQYDIIIKVMGEDKFGNEHTDQMNLKLTIKKKLRDVVVTQASLFPDRIVCSGSSTLTATIKNIGSRLEDEAGIEILNSDLGINFARSEIELEEDPFDTENEFTKRLTINIDKGTSAKTYPININAYLQEGILWDSETANLVVEACAGAETEEEVEEEKQEEAEETETVEAEEGEQESEITEGIGIPVLKPLTTTEIPLTSRPGFWVSVFIINILVLGGAAYFVTSLAGKK